MKPALIIGNGISRKTFPLKELADKFVTFGCNALYRDFEPDWLVAIDDVIIGEIIVSNYPKSRFIVPSSDEQYEPAVWNPSRPRENAGMVAMREAIKKGHQELNCIGMDFLIDDKEFNMGNVFDGTNGYGAETRASYDDCIRRSLYFEWFISQNPETNFRVIFPEKILSEKVFRIPVRSNFQYSYW